MAGPNAGRSTKIPGFLHSLCFSRSQSCIRQKRPRCFWQRGRFPCIHLVFWHTDCSPAAIRLAILPKSAGSACRFTRIFCRRCPPIAFLSKPAILCTRDAFVIVSRRGCDVAMVCSDGKSGRHRQFPGSEGQSRTAGKIGAARRGFILFPCMINPTQERCGAGLDTSLSESPFLR